MKYLKGLLWALLLWNVWVFSRFTVDDAFITWRYGYNLIHHGVWNYNPVPFDPTQAYTNPIFALLSIVPAALGIDVVLFFKVVSIALAVWFFWWFLRNRRESRVWLLLFFMVPATIIHVVSGLETFVFAMLLFFVLVGVVEHRIKLAIWATSLLFLTRPEGWLFLALTPLALAYYQKRFHWRELFKVGSILAAVMAGYFLLHLSLFGELLPNTFYVKSKVDPQWWVLQSIPILLLLLVPLWLVGIKKAAVVAAAFGVPSMLIYSTSQLGMDYASRYAFHVYAPFALLVIYVFSERDYRVKLLEKVRLLKHRVAEVLVYALLALVALGFAIPTTLQEQFNVPTYYPRLLDSQGAIGERVNQLVEAGLVHGTMISDAGLAPYRADVSNLDPILLTTRLGAKHGLTAELFDSYQVDFVAVHASLNLLVTVYPILQQERFTHACNVSFASDYQTQIWVKNANLDVSAICDRSKKANDMRVADYFWKNVSIAPWSFWHV